MKIREEQESPSHTLHLKQPCLWSTGKHGAVCVCVCVLVTYDGLTSASSAAAADSRTREALCGATPEIAECASEETGWEETGHSRATAAASRAPRSTWVMDRATATRKIHVKHHKAHDEMDSRFVFRYIAAHWNVGGWLYFSSTSEKMSFSLALFFFPVCTS